MSTVLKVGWWRAAFVEPPYNATLEFSDSPSYACRQVMLPLQDGSSTLPRSTNKATVDWLRVPIKRSAFHTGSPVSGPVPVSIGDGLVMLSHADLEYVENCSKPKRDEIHVRGSLTADSYGRAKSPPVIITKF